MVRQNGLNDIISQYFISYYSLFLLKFIKIKVLPFPFFATATNLLKIYGHNNIQLYILRQNPWSLLQQNKRNLIFSVLKVTHILLSIK